MVVWFAHVRVGHRQLPYSKSPLYSFLKGCFCILVSQDVFIFWVLSLETTKHAETLPL